ncbi:MAG TPA: glycosyltransferase family 4 protein [Longimicrobiales bacterium]
MQRPHERRRSAATAAAPGLLCVCNFPANTGYAWDFIESLYAGLGDRLAAGGIRTFVAYPKMAELPRTLAGSQATAVELDVALKDATSLHATLSFIRKNNIQAIYLCDRPVWDPRYAALRRAGVQRIIVHDHTSGDRTEPRGLKRLLKRARMALPGSVADDVIAVSDFVARRKRMVDLLADTQVTRVWNSIEAVNLGADAPVRLRSAFGIDRERPVIICAARATSEKGIATLLRAFDRMVATYPANNTRPVLVYAGDGPALEELRALRDSLPAKDDMIIAGFVDKAIELIAGADLCVVPSVWQEAFGLAALEPMACGVAVVATRVGGIPEVVIEGETGVLVTPGEEAELAHAMRTLLDDAAERARLGANGRARAREVFSREQQLEQLQAIVAVGFNGQRHT